MKCPKCGNDLEPGEAFCGQCGTSTGNLGQPMEIAQAPYNGQINNVYQTNIANANANIPSIPPPGPYNTTIMPPGSSYPPGALITPNQTPVRAPTPQQQPGFYQDATESISAFSPAGVQQGNVGGPVIQGNPQSGFPGGNQYAPQGQNFQGGNYTQHSYPPTNSGQGYNYGGTPGSTPQPKRQQNSPFLVIVSVLLVLAIVAVVALGAVYVLNRHTSPRTQITPTVASTPTSAPTPTVVASPTVTPSPTASPEPTVTPTATPFANFSWCDTNCTTNGFAVQYPMTWNESQLINATGVEFLNPTQQDEYAIFKTPGVTSSTAGDLINSDLQANYATQTGYVAPTTTSVETIDGETWTSAVATYQSQIQNPQTPTQKERIEVFATVHGGKGYIIELQAPDGMFDSANTQYFNTIIGSFQFLLSTS